MNKAIFLHELKRNRKSFIIWLIIVVLVTVLVMLFFPSMEKSGGKMVEMLESMPEGMMEAFGMSAEGFADILGFYATYYGMHIMILQGCFVVTLAANLLAREEREGTADFLLVKPVTRNEVFKSKFAAMMFMVLLFLILQMASSGITISIFGKGNVDWGAYAVMNAYGAMLTFMFLGVALLASLLVRKGRALTGTLIGVVVGAYVLAAFSRISEESEFLSWFTPFSWADFGNVLEPDYGFEWPRVVALLGFTLLGVTVSHRVWLRKDIL